MASRRVSCKLGGHALLRQAQDEGVGDARTREKKGWVDRLCLPFAQLVNVPGEFFAQLRHLPVGGGVGFAVKAVLGGKCLQRGAGLAEAGAEFAQTCLALGGQVGDLPGVGVGCACGSPGVDGAESLRGLGGGEKILRQGLQENDVDGLLICIQTKSAYLALEIGSQTLGKGYIRRVLMCS